MQGTDNLRLSCRAIFGALFSSPEQGLSFELDNQGVRVQGLVSKRTNHKAVRGDRWTTTFWDNARVGDQSLLVLS